MDTIKFYEEIREKKRQYRENIVRSYTDEYFFNPFRKHKDICDKIGISPHIFNRIRKELGVELIRSYEKKKLRKPKRNSDIKENRILEKADEIREKRELKSFIDTQVEIFKSNKKSDLNDENEENTKVPKKNKNLLIGAGPADSNNKIEFETNVSSDSESVTNKSVKI